MTDENTTMTNARNGLIDLDAVTLQTDMLANKAADRFPRPMRKDVIILPGTTVGGSNCVSACK